MKLVQLLANELKEWPEGAKYARQDFDGEICFVGGGIWSDFYASCVASDIYLKYGIGASQITEDQWQAEREKMNKPKWIRHRGGNQPVEDIVKVEYRMRDGDISTQPEYASTLRWSHWPHEGDIMAYRVIEETKDQQIEEVKKTNFGTITYKLEIDATEATKEIDSLVAKWGQIESPLKWRDEIIELEAYEEEFRREREKLIRKLESEGLKLIDHMAPVYGEQIIDMSDWRNWQAGDIVECVTDCDNGQFTFGARYAVKSVNRSSVQIVEDDRGSNANGWDARNFKFSSRP